MRDAMLGDEGGDGHSKGVTEQIHGVVGVYSYGFRD